MASADNKSHFKMSLRCFIQELAPFPGSGAQPVYFPACEWVDDTGWVDHLHPLNRYVCSWLTSDVCSVALCEEVLTAMAQVESGERTQWFFDGDAFSVDFARHSVQFNQSNVTRADEAWFDQRGACVSTQQVLTLLTQWLSFHREN
jgi:hypothetical protein